jgi:hypothetical protein
VRKSFSTFERLCQHAADAHVPVGTDHPPQDWYRWEGITPPQQPEAAAKASPAAAKGGKTGKKGAAKAKAKSKGKDGKQKPIRPLKDKPECSTSQAKALTRMSHARKMRRLTRMQLRAGVQTTSGADLLDLDRKVDHRVVSHGIR